MLGSGLHLLLDGEISKPLTVVQMKRFLRHFPRYIGMHRFTEPMIWEKDDECSGIVGIVESHISVHVKGLLVWVDIFSCGYMNTEAAVKGVVRLLGLVQHYAMVIPRPMAPITLTPACQADRRERMEAMAAFTASLPA